MSLNYIHQFQMHIFQTLSNDLNVRTSVDKIYLSIPHDAKYPFLAINTINSINLSQNYIVIYEVSFEICIFTRDKTQYATMYLADKVSNAIHNIHNNFADYIIAGIRLNEIKFEKAKDLISNKASMFYKVAIKPEVL